MYIYRPGLANVIDALLGFEGMEFYSEVWPNLAGLTFGDIMFHFKDAVVVGILQTASLHRSKSMNSFVMEKFQHTGVAGNKPINVVGVYIAFNQ